MLYQNKRKGDKTMIIAWTLFECILMVWLVYCYLTSEEAGKPPALARFVGILLITVAIGTGALYQKAGGAVSVPPWIDPMAIKLPLIVGSLAGVVAVADSLIRRGSKEGS